LPSSLQEIKLGLGWDTRIDLDSSVLCLDRNGDLVENVYYGNLKNGNRSVLHSGDNRTGEGSGDDEVITFKLNQLPQNVDSFWPCITIWTAGNQFDDVKGAYCRLFSGKSQMVRYNLSKNMDNISNGNIVANFKRVGTN
jgi:stress response protein SCP2